MAVLELGPFDFEARRVALVELIADELAIELKRKPKWAEAVLKTVADRFPLRWVLFTSGRNCRRGRGGEADGKIERTKERKRERKKKRKKERGILFIHLPCSFLANGKNPPRVELPYLGAGTWLKLFVTGQKCSSRPT